MALEPKTGLPSDPSVQLTDAHVAQANLYSNLIRDYAFAARIQQLEQATTPEIGDLQSDVSDLQTDVGTLQAETASLLPAGQIRVPVKLTANGTWATYAVAPLYGATITGIWVVTPTVFASTGGTVLLSAKKGSSSGNTLLNAASVDAETLPADAVVALSLTSTSADLVFTGSQLIYLSIVSNNADATGPADGAACVVINFTYAID